MTALRTLAALTVALLSVSPAPARADDAHLYAGGHVGLAQLDSWPARVSFGNDVGVDGRLGLGNRLEAGLTLGRESDLMRYEIELQFGRQQLQQVDLGRLQARADGSVRYHALTANIVRRVPLSGRWSAFGALGLGLGRVTLPQAGFQENGCECFAAATKQTWVYQARLGLELALDATQKPFVQVNALRLPDARGQATSTGPAVSYPRRTALAFSLGYRRDF